jgi:hypothetical protein
MKHILYIEIQKSNFFNNRKYTLEIDGVSHGELNTIDFKKTIALEAGVHQVTLSRKNQTSTTEVNLNEEYQRIFIKPNTINDVIRGVFTGMMVVALFAIFYYRAISGKRFSSSILICFLPAWMIFFKKRKENNFLVELQKA